MTLLVAMEHRNRLHASRDRPIITLSPDLPSSASLESCRTSLYWLYLYRRRTDNWRPTAISSTWPSVSPCTYCNQLCYIFCSFDYLFFPWVYMTLSQICVFRWWTSWTLSYSRCSSEANKGNMWHFSSFPRNHWCITCGIIQQQNGWCLSYRSHVLIISYNTLPCKMLHLN